MKQYGKKGQSVDDLVRAQIRKAESNGRNIDYDTAYEEVIADSMEGMLTDGKVIEKLQQLYKQDKTLVEKISNFINKWVDKVRQIYSRYSPDSKESKLVLEMKDSLEELQSKFAEAIYEASENVTDSSKESDSTTQNPTSNLDMRYDDREYFVEDKYFKSQMSKWEELNHGSYIKVGVIGEKHPLHLIGMPNGVLRYDVDKLKKNMSDHSDYLTVDLLKAIPDIIANPMAISEYSEENTVSVFGDVFIGKSPMMVGVTISRDRAGNDISKVRTYNTRRDVGNLISDQSILYLNEDKKRTRKWFQACGIQVPLGETKFGFIRSVSQIPNAVKLSDRYSDIDLNESALSYFGKTYSWKETGYLLTNGSKLDFSGKHYGASGGYRTVDHRDIWDSFPEDMQEDFDGNGAMVEFMHRGNIRIMPEGDGINLSVLPTEAQEKALIDFISRARGEVTLDIDDEYGENIVSVEYPKGTRSDRVLRDIRQYFKDGTEPIISDLSKFRYSDRDYSFDPELVADLQADRDKLKSDVDNLKELLKLQRTVTHGTAFTKTSVNAAASKLMKSFGMHSGKVELASALNNCYSFKQ